MNTRTQSGFPVIDNLPDADFEFLIDWLDTSWDTKMSSFPKSAQIIAELVALATANGKQISDNNLDAAAAFAENQKRQETIAAKWLREECPPELKENGAIRGDNLQGITTCINKEFAGDFSKLNEAVAVLTQRRELRYSQTVKGRDAKVKTTITGKGHGVQAPEVIGADALTAWLKTAPAAVLDAKGNLGSENLRNIHVVIDAELGGRRTSKNYDIAARLLKARGLLKLTAIQDSEAAARMLEARDEHQRAKSDAQNRHQKADAGKLKEAEEAKALSRIDKIYQSASRDDKVAILGIIRRTKEAQASPLVAEQELVAYASVQKLLAQPLGTKHHEQAFFKRAVQDVVTAELEYSRLNPPTGVAVWGRIARTVAERVTNKFSRGIR